MNLIHKLFSPAISEALGWTIVHALWQGIIVLIVLLILLATLKKHSAQIRYFISFTALVIMLGWSISTFVGGYTDARDKQILKNELLNQQDYLKNLSFSNPRPNELNVSASGLKFEKLKIRVWFQRNFPLLLSIWLVGIGIFTLRLLAGLAYTWRLRTNNLLPFEARWMHKLKELAAALKISRKISAYQSAHASTPLTLGFLKPIILFPVKMLSGLSDKKVEAIIAHELAHIVRNDYLFNIIQSIIEILFFYHPAIWRMSAHIRREREHACDDIAINLTGDKLSYVQALAHPSISGQAGNISIYSQKNLSMGFAHKKSSLLERVKRIQKQRAMKTNFSEGLIAACIILSSIFLLSFSLGNQFNESNPPLSQSVHTEEQSLSPQTRIATLPKAQAKAKKDSLLRAVEKNVTIVRSDEKLSKEIIQAIEIALTENDESLSAEIMEEINMALKEISESGIQDAMKEARIEIKAAMAEINSDSIQEEIRTEMKEAREEINKAMKENQLTAREKQEIEETTELSLKAAETGLKMAAEVLESIDIESIVATSLEAANTAIELAGKQIEAMHLDSLIDAEINTIEIEIDKNDLNRSREQLKRDKAQLQKDLKELKKDMKKLKKEIKKELKEAE
ncbi:BlaR1 peptidase M56 [Saccharicrinis carchari]|uniref:BlaR1 peptidase M56 n=1 Tax=Saccharicrinis carchari TaxID=1168039 RepID=A0A521D1C6_SACCC|nr:M56 family metallopeptidase [Saccharicrinis carchari]SMO65462.1 BlaR1 peptidase M56 [Saccharicrinis carchari]